MPQRLLSDNGLALNPSRRGYLGQLVAHVCRARRRGDHRQAVQADHPGQERTLPPDPVPLPRQAAHRRHPGRTPGPGRRVRPHLQHRAPPPGAARAHHAAARRGKRPRRPIRPARNPTGRSYEPPAHQPRPRPKPPADLPADTRVRTRDHRRHHSGWTRSPTRSTDSRAFEQVLDRHATGDKIIVTDLRRRDPHRAHPTRTRHRLRRQRPTPRTPPQEPGSVTEVLTHQLSPMS